MNFFYVKLQAYKWLKKYLKAKVSFVKSHKNPILC